MPMVASSILILKQYTDPDDPAQQPHFHKVEYCSSKTSCNPKPTFLKASRIFVFESDMIKITFPPVIRSKHTWSKSCFHYSEKIQDSTIHLSPHISWLGFFRWQQSNIDNPVKLRVWFENIVLDHQKIGFSGIPDPFTNDFATAHQPAFAGSTYLKGCFPVLKPRLHSLFHSAQARQSAVLAPPSEITAKMSHAYRINKDSMRTPETFFPFVYTLQQDKEEKARNIVVREYHGSSVALLPPLNWNKENGIMSVHSMTYCACIPWSYWFADISTAKVLHFCPPQDCLNR